MALDDDFDSYTAGDLNGQGSWSGSTTYDVETSVFQSSPNGVQCASGGDVVISKSFSATAADTQSFYIRNTSTSRNLSTYFKTGATTIAWVAMNLSTGDGAIKFVVLGNVAITLLAGYSADTWYQIEVEWDAALGTNGQLRARIDGGTWTAWTEPTSNFDTLDTVELLSDASSSTAYWDSFSTVIAAATGLNRGLNLLGVGQ